MPRDIDFAALSKLQTAFGMHYPPRYEIFRQGRRGADFYVILEGEIEMIANVDGVDSVLAVLHPGDFFGEMAVFRNEPRSATARTRTAAAVLYFNSSTVNELFLASPRFAYGIIRTLCDRIGALDHEVVTLRQALMDHRRMEEAAGLSPIIHHMKSASNAASSALTDTPSPTQRRE